MFILKSIYLKVKNLIKNSTDDDKYDLINAAKYGHLEVVKFLVKNGADVHIEDDFALRAAAYNGYLEVVKYLVENGADVHAYSDCALRWAAQCGNLETVKCLVENGADIHVNSDSPLWWAVENGRLEVVNYLRKVYSKRYKDKFLCHNCLVLSVCTELCSNRVLK